MSYVCWYTNIAKVRKSNPWDIREKLFNQDMSETIRLTGMVLNLSAMMVSHDHGCQLSLAAMPYWSEDQSEDF